jgi:hypothetical protein
VVGESQTVKLIGHSRIQTDPCRRRRFASWKTLTRFPLPHRSGGWMSEWKIMVAVQAE